MSTLLWLVAPAHAELIPVLMESGPFQVSIDGAGSAVTANHTFDITRPSAGSTVFAAFAAVTSTFNQPDPGRSSLTVAGVALTLDQLETDGGIHTRFDDVTAELAATLLTLPVGTSAVPVIEGGAPLVNDGCMLFVVWHDPTFDDLSVSLALGSALTSDVPSHTMFVDPIDTTVPGFQVEAGLGLSFSTGMGQISAVEVNGAIVTTSAGGFDDGAFANGALYTIGGDGDGAAEERYDVTSLVSDGDTAIALDIIGLTLDDYAVASWQIASGVEVPCSPSDPGAIGFAAPYFVDQDGDGFGASGSTPAIACDGPPAGFVDDATDCDDSDPAVLPGSCLVMTAGPVVPGSDLEVTVTGANPGETVFVLRSQSLAGSCPRSLGAVCMALGNPNHFGSAVANGAGVAVVRRLVPVGAPPQSVRFLQAAVVRPAPDSEVSGVVEIVVP